MKLMVNDLIHGGIKEVASIDFINGSALLWIKRGSTRVTVQRWLDDIELIDNGELTEQLPTKEEAERIQTQMQPCQWTKLFDCNEPICMSIRAKLKKIAG